MSGLFADNIEQPKIDKVNLNSPLADRVKPKNIDQVAG